MERTVRLIQRLGVELVDDVWHIRAESFYKNPYESHRPGYETWHHDTFLIPFSNVTASLDAADRGFHEGKRTPEGAEMPQRV